MNDTRRIEAEAEFQKFRAREEREQQQLERWCAEHEDEIYCSACNGIGLSAGWRCPECHGSGLETRQRRGRK